MKALWTGLPHQKEDPRYVLVPPMTQAPDNTAQHKVLVYGPKGEALIEQRPRPVGFRPR